MASTEKKKTHAQISKELRDAFNERGEAEKLHRRDDVDAANAKITELRSKLPPPKGTKPRWK